MGSVDNIGRYSKRLMQKIWDPEPRNDDPQERPIWCLGRRYEARAFQEDGDDAATVTTAEVAANAATPAVDVTASEDASNGGGAAVPSKPPLASRITSSGFEHVEKDDRAVAVNGDGGGEWPREFLDDFESRLWMTYRSGFPQIARNPVLWSYSKTAPGMQLEIEVKNPFATWQGLTSDTGWGCMIRSGQSLLANALGILRLGRDARRDFGSAEERRLVSLFADDPRAPYSIHRFVEHGATACGTSPGQWFGPSATARCIEALCHKDEETGLKVYVTGDGPDVFEDTLLRIARGGTGTFHPTLLLVATRLGIDRVTPVYREALRSVLMLPQSVGIAGGRPSSSHYFVGTQGDSFFYLDPHHTRPALPWREDASDRTPEEVGSCHTRRLRRLSVEEMDPSMLIGFLLRDEEDWRAWRRSITGAPGKRIFHIADSQTATQAPSVEREAALDEVETFDEEHDPDDALT